MRIKLYIVFLLVIVVSCKESKKKTSNVVDTLPYYSEATFKAHWEIDHFFSLNAFHKIPSFRFTNQDGEFVTDKTFKDKIYVTNFFFTSCSGICPKMTSKMKMIQEEFLKDDDVMLLSHSVTPSMDSVPVLKQYALGKEIVSGKWHLVTGSQDEIYKLGREAYFIEEDLGIKKSKDDFLHTENIVLIDKNKHIRGIYNGLNRTSVNHLIKDIYLLKEED